MKLKEELKFMGYLYVDLSRLTYIGLSRVKAILSYNLTATDEEISSIKKSSDYKIKTMTTSQQIGSIVKTLRKKKNLSQNSYRKSFRQ
jgi:hypothetical protein